MGIKDIIIYILSTLASIFMGVFAFFIAVLCEIGDDYKNGK